MGMNIIYSSHYSRHFAQRVKIEIAIIMSKISINSFYNWKPVSILSSKQQAEHSKQQACPVVQACAGVVRGVVVVVVRAVK